MSEDTEDQESKTEDASEKKLTDAVERGQVVNSREINHFFILLFLTIVIIFILPSILISSATTLRFFIENAGSISIDKGVVGILFSDSIFKFLVYLSPILLITVIVALLSSYIQHGSFVFAIEQIQPDFSRISLVNGLKRLFSVRSLVELLKSFLKITIVGAFIYWIVSNDVQDLMQYQYMPISGILTQLRSIINNIMLCVCIIMAIIAIADFFFQRFEYLNNLKMTKREQKEEHKQLEGNPEIKRKIKSLRRQQAQKRIKQTVPKATVVITNPQHYAVALYYDPKTTTAPILVAKGLDLIAQNIKVIAQEHEIPVVENPPLARSIYKHVEVDEEIPIEHYEAVAKVISYVMSLNKKKKG